MNEIRYLISDASKKVDVETHVLRYWEEELGLSIPRNEMGHRYYTEFHIRLFCQVKNLKDRGYQLKAIKNALQQVMARNQGFMQAEGVLEEDMARTLQDNQPSTWKKDKEVVQEGIARLADYNRLEPVKEGQAWKEQQTEEGKITEKIQNKPELKEKDGQTEMKKKGKNRKKLSAWERRNGMIGNEQEGFMEEREENFQVSVVQEMNREEDVQEKCNLEDETPENESQENDGSENESLDKEERENTSAQVAEVAKDQDSELWLIHQDEKMQQFQKIMNYIIGHALEVNNEKLSQEISSLVNERLTEELEDLMRIRDERDEERFRHLDEIIRSYQRDSQGKAEAAAARIPFFRKRRFRKRRPPQNA